MCYLTIDICGARVNKPVNIVDVEVTKHGNLCCRISLEKTIKFIGDAVEYLTVC